MLEERTANNTLTSLIDELLSTWDASHVEVRSRPKETTRLAMVVALAQHAHRLGHAFRSLDELGFGLETMPITRALFETALRGQWVGAIKDAPEALLKEHDRQRRNLTKSAVSSGWIPEGDAAEVLAAVNATTPLDSRSSAAQVEVMCNDLKGAGLSAYTMYRSLSTYCHPNVLLVDLYVGPDQVHSPGFLSRVENWQRGLALFPVATSLVWAGRAVDRLDVTHSRRSQLQAAARTLGIPQYLTVSDVAWKRLSSRVSE